jgi:CheY-like chemotaxis protein
MKSYDTLFSGKNILIVDDDVRNTFALSSYLQGIDMHTHVAANGFEALEFLSQNSSIDIILMDMMMPEMDGFEAIYRIRNNKAIMGIPIIAVTAKAMKGDREICLEAGATEYVSKPVDIKELLEKMAQVLNLK